MEKTPKKHAAPRSFAWYHRVVIHGVKKEISALDGTHYQMWCGKWADSLDTTAGAAPKKKEDITCKSCRLIMHLP